MKYLPSLHELPLTTRKTVFSHLKPHEETILTSGKMCCVQYLLVFRLISVYTDERLIPGLRRKDWILRALLLVVTSLWAHKVGSSVEIYSARWKFMLISDQAKDLVKNCFEGGGSMSPFQQIYPFDLYNRWVLASQQKVLGPCKCALFRAMQTYRNYSFSCLLTFVSV